MLVLHFNRYSVRMKIMANYDKISSDLILSMDILKESIRVKNLSSSANSLVEYNTISWL